MWWQIGMETRTIMPTKLGVDLKHELLWNIISFYGLNTQWFHIELLWTNDAILQKHPWWFFFLIMNLVINFHTKRLTRTKNNRMKKIVFSKLWEHDAYYKVESVHFQNKRFGRVYTNQEWRSGERSFQRLKKLLILTP